MSDCQHDHYGVSLTSGYRTCLDCGLEWELLSDGNYYVVDPDDQEEEYARGDA